MYPVLLFIPLVLLCYDRHVRVMKNVPSVVLFALKHFAVLAGSIASLLGVSYLLTGGSWEFISATYGVQLLVPDLTPNVGLWWYFFIEIFDSFREFFLGVFWLHLAGYMGGLTIRLRRQPLFVVTTLLGIFAIFQPYPSISDVSLYFALIPLYRHLFPCMYIPLSSKEYHLTVTSDALHVLCRFCLAVCHPSRSCILPPLDLCRVWKRQFLLCHHPSLESGSLDIGRGLDLRCAQGRVGARKSRNEGQGCETDISILCLIKCINTLGIL